MSRVQYDGQRLIPAPLVDISKQYQKTGAGENIGSIFNITLTGTIVAFKGSPTTSGTFHTSGGFPPDEVIVADSRLSAILRKQEAIRELFSQDGLSLEIQALDASEPLKCNPRVINIDFPAGIWYNVSPYTITLEADILYPEDEDSFPQYISSAEENWTIDTDEGRAEDENVPRTYILTHSVSAVGKKFYDETGTGNTPFHEARNYVLSRLGFDSTIALSSGVNNLPSYYTGYNHVRSENIDETGGSYSVTETWVLASGTALEDFTVSSERSIDTGLWRVNIQGNIEGLEQRDPNLGLTTHKYTNAITKFNTASGLALTRAQTYSGQTLNVQPITQSIGRNPVTGTINYTFEYDNRPSTIIEGSLSEVININDDLTSDVFGTVPVLGRTLGPVLQSMNTINPLGRSLNIELVMPTQSYTDNESALRNLINNNPRVNPTTSGTLQNIIRAADPFYAGLTNSYTDSHQETWDFINGRYSYQVHWTYELG